MDLVDIMLNEMSGYTKTNTVWYHLYVESKNLRLVKAESGMVVIRGLGVGDWEMLFKGTSLQPVDK